MYVIPDMANLPSTWYGMESKTKAVLEMLQKGMFKRRLWYEKI